MKALSCAQPSDPGKKERRKWKENGRKMGGKCKKNGGKVEGKWKEKITRTEQE